MKPPKQITAYHHPPVAAPSDEQVADPQPGNYYVTVKDGERLGLLVGPLPKHQQALDLLPAARAKAQEADAYSAFYSFGTVRMAEGFTKPGVLNKFFNLA